MSTYQGETWILDSSQGVWAGQARSEYPATFVLFSNRRHVDAAKTIQAFTGRLREELDLDTLTAELLVVVVANQTIEPTKTSLWLRPSAEGSRRIIG